MVLPVCPYSCRRYKKHQHRLKDNLISVDYEQLCFDLLVMTHMPFGAYVLIYNETSVFSVCVCWHDITNINHNNEF